MNVSLPIGDRIPVIDCAAIESPDLAARRDVATRIRQACEQSGFFYVRNHGVPAELIAETFAAARAFFDRPPEIKAAVHRDKSPCFRGFDPMSNQTLQAGTPPDLKEGFMIGVDQRPDDPLVMRGLFGLGPNQWPAGDDAFRRTAESYHLAMRRLGVKIMRGIALSLDLPIEHFDDYSRGPLARIKLLHYPPQPPNPRPDEKGCGAHTDFGGITVLAQDDCGGLQVWSEHDGWIDASPIPGTLVVNLGDMMARWTNDRYRSTLHRVINFSGRERYSIPFFMSGDPDHEVACLPNCRKAGEAPKYPPTTVEEHFRRQYSLSYA